MIKKKQKTNNISVLFALWFILVLVANITPAFIPKIQNNIINIDEDNEELLEEPEVADLTQEMSGPGSSVGLYGYSNGTYSDDFIYTDTWTDIGGGVHRSETYSVNTPTNVASEPWKVDGNEISVANVRDKKNYVPDPNFVNQPDWTEHSYDSGNIQSWVDDSNSRGVVEWMKKYSDYTVNPFNNFPDHWISNGVFSNHYIQNPNTNDAGDAWSTTFTQPGGGRYVFQGRMDSYVRRTNSHSGGGDDGGNCNAFASVSMNDDWSIAYSTTSSSPLVTLADVNYPQAWLDFDLEFDNTYSTSIESHYWDPSRASGDSIVDVHSSVTIAIYIIDPNAVANYVGGITRNFDNYGSTGFTNRNYGSPVYDIDSIFVDTGNYYLRMYATITFANTFTSAAQEQRSCSGHCSVNCYAEVRGETDNRLQFEINDIRFNIQDVITLPDYNITLDVATPMNFQNREVLPGYDQVLTFDFIVDNSLTGEIEDSKVGAWIIIGGQTYWELSTFGLQTLKGATRTFTWNLDSGDKPIPWSTLDGAGNIELKVGVFMSDMMITSDFNSRVYFYDVRLELEGQPDVEDIGLQIYTPGGGRIPVNIPKDATKGEGSIDLSAFGGYLNIDLSGGTISSYFRTTSDSLTMDFSQSLQLSFEAWGQANPSLYTRYHCYSSGDAEFYLNFTTTTPYGDPLDFSEPYQDNIYYEIVFPRYLAGGEPYWDLDTGWFDGWDSRILTGEENASNISPAGEIFVDENTTRTIDIGDGPYEVKQVATIFWDGIQTTLNPSAPTVLDCDILFTSPNFVSNVALSNDTMYPAEAGLYVAHQDDMIIKGTLLETVEKGNASLAALNSTEEVIGKRTMANGTFSTEFVNDGSPIDLPNLLKSGNDYIGYAGYTAINIANKSSGDRCLGTYKVGFQSKLFRVIRDTVVNGPEVWIGGVLSSEHIFDTWKDRNDLIEIKVQYLDDNAGSPTPITDGDVFITIGEFKDYGSIGYKQPGDYITAEWDMLTRMNHVSNGWYRILADPNRNTDGTLKGNMSWGFHNFTVTLSKPGFITKYLESNFSIIKDTYIEIWTPWHDMDPFAEWTHFMDDMPAGEPIGISIRYLINDSTQSAIKNETGLYTGKVHIEYVLTNATGNLINWTAVDTYILPEHSPHNGTFTGSETSAVYDTTIMWPTFSQMGSMADFKEDVIVEYNITGWIERNETADMVFKNPDWVIRPGFQPDHLEAASCENESRPGFDSYEDLYGSRYKVFEETVRVRLIEKSSVNKTAFRLIDDVIDNGDAFGWGVFDNYTEDELPERDPQYYVVKNYWYNSTNDWFKLRGLFNCTGILLNTESDPAPPVGPLNETNIFYGKELKWAGNTTIKFLSSDFNFNMTPDDSYLWTCEVNHTSATQGPNPPSSYINASGVTYVGPQIYFRDYAANTYTCTIQAKKGGFETDYVTVVIMILPQKTETYNDTGDTVDTTLNPIEITVPRWNSTSFIVQYNDTTNPVPLGINNVDDIEIYSDDLLDYYINQSGPKSSWSWKPLGNGRYEITLKETDLNPRTIELYFRINKQNYTSAEFRVSLTIRKRNAQVVRVWNKNGGIGVHDPDYYDTLSHAHLIISYEIIDLDNNSEPIYLSNQEISDSFTIDYFLTSISRLNINGRWTYNITVGTNRPVGAYLANLTIAGLTNYYDIAKHSTNIQIIPIPVNMTLVSLAPVVREFVHYEQSITTYTLLPRFDFVYWDEAHHDNISLSGTDLDGNWTNNYGALLDPGTTNEDILLLDRGDGLGSIYIDIQMNSSRANPYFINITLSKTYYETAYLLINLTIIDQTAHFDNDETKYGVMLYGQAGDLGLTEISTSYYAGEYLGRMDLWASSRNTDIFWGNRLYFKFTYVSYKGIELDNDTGNGLPVIATLESLHPELTYTIEEQGSGEYSFRLDLTEISSFGEVNIVFNISIGAQNFETVKFLVNITMYDRGTIVDVLSWPETGVYWTEEAIFQIQVLDKQYFNRFGYIGEGYNVSGALINGSSNDEGGTYKTTNWTVQEQSWGRYLLIFNTTKLLASKDPYIFYLNISKPHWSQELSQFNFTVRAVPYIITLKYDPSDTFVSEKINEFKILVSLSVHITYLGIEKDWDIADLPPSITGTITVTCELILEEEDESETSVFDGELDWDPSKRAFIVVISTEIDDDYLIGILDLTITVSSSSPNFQTTTKTDTLMAIGTRVGGLPPWFWILLSCVVGAAVAMSAYGVKKAIYLRIPFVLRKIDETTKKIEKDKFPAVGVMTGREEFIINSVINFLEMCGIEWEREDKFEIKKVGEAAAKEKLPPMSLNDIKEALESIEGLSQEERHLFVEELKMLDRGAQDEFLASLRGDVSKGPKD